MKTNRFDVIVIGAGPAGVAAAGALSGSGISVALIEAGVYAGAENWSGCVYFTENLAADDCFGHAAVTAAPYERPVVRRGTIVLNGADEVGLSLTDPKAFDHCYTVLRPVYDAYFAALARNRGVVLITGTTVTSLIRKDGRVTGVQTDRGPLQAGVVFIAEGDASHLVRSEGLERTAAPHYLQGVKAVLSLPPAEIENRFGLNAGEGAAYELLVRNPSISGRTAKLNIGGFLYTNRDSLSLGYVVPLENLRKNYRGDHDRLFEWLKGLPAVSELAGDARLSAYGTKIIRSGGWRERPVLVEDGLAVGGASAGLGIDIPFPNFTGPASATGLFFARAVRALLKEGRSFDAKNLSRAYLEPLKASRYGRDARYLSHWPAYFGRSQVLFGRTADLLCGTVRFLSGSGLAETGRFLRGHLLSFRALRETLFDTAAAAGALRLWRPLVRTVLDPRTVAAWITNHLRHVPEPDGRLGFIMNIGGRRTGPASLPWPLGGFLTRISPALARAVSTIYANNGEPAEQKFAAALRTLARSLRLADLFLLPAFGLLLFLAALGTAVVDTFRYYVLKIPAEKFLAAPVMSYGDSQRKTRDLDAVKPSLSLEAKLATNTYRVGGVSHIRTLWPGPVAEQPELSRAALWWVCPARVYAYDAPLLGRGRVTVSWENCIKCESCWRAEPDIALWGRFTDHKLIYRPESGAIADLLGSLKGLASGPAKTITGQAVETKLWYLSNEDIRSIAAALNAARAFRDSLLGLPASADAGRRSWPLALGARLIEKMKRLEDRLRADERIDPAGEIRDERKDLERRLGEGRLFHALYAVLRIEHMLRSWTDGSPSAAQVDAEGMRQEESVGAGALSEEMSRLFPDRVVKQWEEEPMTGESADKLRLLIAQRTHPSTELVRALSSVSPALGLIASHQTRALALLRDAGREAIPGVCAISGAGIALSEAGDRVKVTGKLELVPTAACTSLLLITQGKAFIIPFASPGVTIVPTPAIGFRAAGLSTITLDCTMRSQDVFTVGENGDSDAASYLAIALGAGDYLSRRASEHAAGRVQFPGQMLDTEGRDGIAKLGAVKALLARVEAWRLVLETVYHSALRAPNSELSLLCSSLAAIAFGPESGRMAYDAGQVFGGFAFSEDDLLSRSYRDSSLFRFLAPGHRASERLHESLAKADLGNVLAGALGTLGGITGPPLAHLAKRWSELRSAYGMIPAGADQGCAGDAAALLLGVRGLLAAVEEGLGSGRSMEQEAASAEVLLHSVGDAVERAALSAGRGEVPPDAVFPAAPDIADVDLGQDYESFCTRSGRPHRSGTFLLSVFDRSPRYVPEMQLHDPKLRQLWTGLTDWFRQNASGRTYEGLPFERHVEKIHNLPAEIIEAVKEHRWLATYVPKAEDGLGWRKAEYYVLNSAAGSFSDASVCLLIMASTSIGTTPVLLGLEDELPRVREELKPLVDAPERLGAIGSRIKRIVASFRNPNPAWIRKEYSDVMKLVDERIRRTRVVKYLAANFLRAFYGAGIAGRRGDFGGFMTGLTLAAELFERVLPDVRGSFDELPRRERAHRLFLRNLGHGGVSAFALTEPTAGSDSGGVKTTAVLRTAMLAVLPDGRYVFSPTGEMDKCKRYLIDADRITFTDEGMAYLTPDNRPSPIRYDRYDYTTDEGARYYEHQGGTCEFHDIAQVRMTAAGPQYEYYSLTGAKMWITNGSLATQFSLFAQTPEGVTGFMVDRHAEGLKVGADERKTGQRGSPTNELSLDSVRVPREAVIGYEGHGQVNALETLNAGRCGLAVVAGALSRKLMAEALAAIPPSDRRDRLLGEAAAIQFGSESLAYCLIGLFDRPHESVRMESAIAKYVCSEDVHEIISLLEQAYGPVGQTEQHLLEKARRDARILNIYEGTNEVQRFLILKDLIGQAADWPELPERIPERPDDDAAVTLSRWKNRLRKRVRAARQRFGDAAWSDAMLQPALFPLSEMAGEVLRLECTTWRLEWLGSRRELLGASYVDPLLAAGRRAAERALAKLDHLDRSAEAAWQVLESDLMVPEVRAADALLDRAARKTDEVPEAAGAMTVPFRILSIVRPTALCSPSPRLSDGAITELIWEADPLDRAGLEQALALKAASGPKVTIDVLMPCGPEFEPLVRSTAASADRLIRLDRDGATGPLLAETIRELELSGPYDLIVLGANSLDGDHGLASFLAGRLKRPYQPIERIETAADGSGIDRIAAHSVVGITRPWPTQRQSAAALVDSLSRDVAVLQPPAGAPRRSPRFSRPVAAATETRTVATVSDAAAYLTSFAAEARTTGAEAYAGTIGKGQVAGDAVVWALMDNAARKADLAAVRSCRMAADLFGRKACALIAAPRDQWPLLLGLARTNGMDRAFCLDTAGRMLSFEGRQQVLGIVMEGAQSPMIVAGTGWNDALGMAAGRHAAETTVQLATGITEVRRNADGSLEISVPVYGGKLVREVRVVDGSIFLTMSEEAGLPEQTARETFTAVEMGQEIQPGWTVPLPPPAAPTLSSAEVIIDLGYGVRDRAGLALALELKAKLEAMGLAPMLGATRKVTQDLKLLPLDAQIGQTGVRVNPKLVIALGISGAPQHVDWIGSRAEILCFNKDPEAPLMKLNQTHPAPRVHPISGDLFLTVRELIGKLG